MAALGCERLPSSVVVILNKKVETACEKMAVRIVARELTANKISRLLLEEMRTKCSKNQGGFKGEAEAVPFDQADSLIMQWRDETEAVTGTNAPTNAPIQQL